MRIDNQELLKQLKEWSDSGENAKIVSAARLLPKKELDDEILTIIADAYIEEKNYKGAVNILESQRERLDGDYHWHFRMGMALYLISRSKEYRASGDLRQDILERSQVCFARCMNLNPPDNVMNEAGNFLDRLEDEFRDLDGEDEEDEYEDDDCELYDEDELDAIEDHIEEYFGDFPTVFHEIRSSDIHCDIYIVPPTETRDYYTLITVGMGAHVMDLPEGLETEESGRAELMICLPKNWKIGENDPKWFWPISLLKNLSRLPINCETWLGWGHSVDNKDMFAENTKLCGSLLIYPEDVGSGADTCKLPNGDTVNFFEVIPLYREEIDFKVDNDAHALLEKMNVSHIVDISRENVCKGYMRQGVIDSARLHSEKIVDKKLPLDMINGCNHIAIFLRWCIEHDLYNKYFFDRFPGVAEDVKDKTNTDLRKFMFDCTNGELNSNALSFFGYIFTRRYYDFHNSFSDCFYPADVDTCAENYFGTEKYNSEEFQDEAYLFVPFDEEYYKNLSKFIDRAYDIFYNEYLKYYFDHARPMIEKAEKLFKTECIFPKDQRQVRVETKRILKECAKFGDYPLLLILDMLEEPTEDHAEELLRVLHDCNEPFVIPMAAAKTQTDAINNFDMKNSVVLKSDKLEEAVGYVKKRFGIKPTVLELSPDGTYLMFPEENGGYLLIKGE